MKFELVDEAKTVFLTSWTSILAILATLCGVLGAMQSHLNLLEPLIGPKLYAFIVLAADGAPQAALGLTAAIPFARVVKQRRLQEIAARAGQRIAEAKNDAYPNVG